MGKVKFKVGDTIRCIDSKLLGKMLSEGQEYVVTKTREDIMRDQGVYLKGLDPSQFIYSKRFELAEGVKPDPEESNDEDIKDLIKTFKLETI